MPKFAFVFPGQGSQSAGMMSGWGVYQNIVDDCFAEASAALGYDLQSIINEDPADRLNQTHITQPAMLASAVATFRVWKQLNLPLAEIFSGHSLGEYAALVCAESIGFSDAVQLVAQRGRLMQSAVAEGEGGMAAIIGLADDDVVKACRMVSTGIVSAVNFNSPGQVVIAGHRESVEQAMQNARQLGAKRALALAVSVPSHCALMEPAAEKLYEYLLETEIRMPRVPVIHNQNAKAADSVEEIRTLLKLQLSRPVLWVGCVQTIKNAGINMLIELGPGKVLTGLTRRIDKSMQAHAVFDLQSIQNTQQSLLETE